MAEREVVTSGIGRVEASEGRGDLLGRLERWGSPSGETEVSGQAMDVHVDGDEQPRGVDVPEAEVHAVGGADHPAQEEQEAFRAARAAWIGKEMRRASAARALVPQGVGRSRDGTAEARCGAEGVAPRRESLAQRLLSVELGLEEGAEGPVPPLEGPRACEKPREVLPAKYPVLPNLEAPLEHLAILGEVRGARTEAAKQVTRLGDDRLGVTEGNGGCREADELAIERVVVPVGERHRVGRQAGGDVATSPHLVERRLDRALASGKGALPRVGSVSRQ